MVATASRPNSGLLTSQFVHSVERVNKKVGDIVYRDNLTLQMFDRLGIYQTSTTSMAEINPIIDQRDVTVTRFATGYENLPIPASSGAGAFYVEYANYAAPVAMSWVEEQKIRDPYEIINLAQVRYFKAGKAIAEALDQDIFWGTNNDANAITGLEQALISTGQAAGTAAATAAYPVWRFRQAANSYLGITRAAFTAEDTTGTGWEGCAMDLDDAVITYTSDANEMLKTLGNEAFELVTHFYNMMCYGSDFPDLMISTHTPLEHYSIAAAGTIQIHKQGGKIDDINLGFGTSWFRGALWVSTPRAAASGLSGTASANDDMIYFLNTKYIRLEVSDTGDFVMTPFTSGAGQVSAACQLLWRGQFIMDNPRMNGVAFSYHS